MSPCYDEPLDDESDESFNVDKTFLIPFMLYWNMEDIKYHEMNVLLIFFLVIEKSKRSKYTA